GDHDLVDLLVPGKYPQSVNHDGRAVELKKLFGGNTLFSCRRHASAQAGRGNDDDYLHNGVRSITISLAAGRVLPACIGSGTRCRLPVTPRLTNPGQAAPLRRGREAPRAGPTESSAFRRG